MSPSSQRVWIEITETEKNVKRVSPSPSSQRVWIEIEHRKSNCDFIYGRPLHRGCGLKSTWFTTVIFAIMSPSSQRVWIEIGLRSP